MSDVMSRERLSIQKFYKSGEVPPADYEEYIVWLYRSMVMDEKEAIRAIADWRRDRPQRLQREATKRGLRPKNDAAS